MLAGGSKGPPVAGGAGVILDASSLTTWQRGRRRWALERRYYPVKWHPKSLLDACLRHAIFHTSSEKKSSTEAAQDAVNRYLALAADPGLDIVSGDPYTIAMDYCAMIRTIMEYIGRLTLLVLGEPKPVPILPDLTWKPIAFQDESHTLHRWITVDAWDEDAIAREIHSWFVFGDVAACQAPMMIHPIIIGQIRNGRRASPWARAYKHPAIANVHRFQKTDGSHLDGDWKPIYFADNRDNDPKTWVDLMLGDKLMLVKHVPINMPAQEHIDSFHAEVIEEAQAMRGYLDRNPLEIPMCRVSCDGPRPCAFQEVCYRTGPVTIETFAGFKERKR